MSVPPSTVVRDLGVLFDGALTLTAYISRTVSTCFYQLRQLKSIRRCLPVDLARTIVNAFVVSRLDYCNGLLAGQPAYQLRRLQLVQNAAARLIVGIRRSEHISPTLRSLHWLRCTERITYKLCLTVFNALHGQAPAYIRELCLPVSKIDGRQRLRSAGTLNIVEQGSETKFGERAFRVAGPRAWNKLPAEIKCAPTVASFKSKLKTFLFNTSYP